MTHDYMHAADVAFLILHLLLQPADECPMSSSASKLHIILCISLLAGIIKTHTFHIGKRDGSSNMAASSYTYIPKLSLKAAHRERIEELMVDVEKQQQRLLAEFRAENYETLSVDERISEAHNLLSTNLPATAALLKQTLTSPALTVKQQMLCYRLLYLVYMSLGPLSEGQEAAKQEYRVVKTVSLSQIGNRSSATGTGNVDPQVSTSSPEINEMRFQAALDLGNAHRFLGNMGDAKIHLDEAMAVAVAMDDTDKITTATIHHGEWILASGHLKDAISQVFQPLLKRNMSDRNRGILLQAFGNAARAAADWGPAKEYMREAIAIAERLNDPIAVADRQGDLGTIFRSEGRTSDALLYQKKQFVFASGRGDQAALCVSCFNIGFTHYSMKPPDYDIALIYHSIHLELAERIGYLAMKSRALNALGKIYTALRDYESAILLLEECLEVHSKIGNHRGLGIAYGNIGTVYRAMGKFDEAIVYHEKYRKNAAERDDVGGVAIMQRELAMDYLFKEDLDMAEQYITDAFFTLERIRAKIGAEDSSRIANFEKNQSEAFNLLQTILIRKGKYREALALSEQGRARALADLIQQNQEELEPGSPRDFNNDSAYLSTISMLEERFTERALSDIFQTASELNTTLVIYSIVTEFTPAGDVEKWLYSWVVARETTEPTNGEIRNVPPSDPTNRGGATVKDGDWKVHFAKGMLSSEKKTQEAILDDKHVNALCRSLAELSVKENIDVKEPDVCASKDQTECTEASTDHIEDSPARDIPHRLYRQEKLAHVYGGLEETKPKQPVTDPRLQRALDKLRVDYDIFIAPIESFLPEWREGMADVPRITFIPQDYMFNLPFCALLGPDNLHLIQKYVISFVPSVRTLKLTNQRLTQLRQTSTTAPPSVLAVGNPTMPHPKIPALPAATEEAKMVKKYFQSHSSLSSLEGEPGTDSMVLTGNDATVDNVRQKMTGHSVLHFATHAEQDNRIVKMIKEGTQDCQPERVPTGDFSMQGFLVLARSHENCSGLLMAEEVKDQRLKAEVAVLSCCQTGKGQVTGDGVLGLYRSFLVAGAASVVVTQWKIYDKATAQFMRHFYQDFIVHRDSARALREAMLSMLADRGEHHLPQHWAAFALIGASRLIQT
ncbi:tetratricopeptide repeat protein 28-like [Patiria miniata]|uniref:CHAT domain-containing protein n=1 Tax=Patiria miniata TaxID=46514 RepID=A0A913ZQY1_PATMI|nr:tetratricopeptide repeat protein 28-like [Patiria miniata]